MTKTIALLLAVAATVTAAPPAGAQQPVPQPLIAVPAPPPPPIFADTVERIVAAHATERRPHYGGLMDIVAAGLELPATIIAGVTLGECVPGTNPCR